MKKICVFCVLGLLLLSGCNKEEPSERVLKNEENHLDFSADRENLEKKNNDSEDSIVEMGDKDKYLFTLNEANIYEPQESIDIDGIVFSDIEINICKELPEGIDKSEIIYFEEQTDENGTLIGSNTYIFADVTIQNTCDSEQAVYLSSGKFSIINNQNNIIETSNELRYRGFYEPDKDTGKDYYRSEFEAGETLRIKLGYIVDEEFVKQDNLLYSINFYGVGSGDDLKAFRIW